MIQQIKGWKEIKLFSHRDHFYLHLPHNSFFTPPQKSPDSIAVALYMQFSLTSSTFYVPRVCVLLTLCFSAIFGQRMTK